MWRISAESRTLAEIRARPPRRTRAPRRAAARRAACRRRSRASGRAGPCAAAAAPTTGCGCTVSMSGPSARSGASSSSTRSGDSSDRRLDDDERPAREERRQFGQRREAEHAADGGDGVGHVAGPRGPGLQHLLGALEREEQRAGDDLGDREEAELERGHDAEVAAAAAHRPEQLGVVLGVDPPAYAVGRDEFDRDHGVGGDAVRAGEPADAAAERVADDADVVRRSGERGEAVRRDRGDDVAPEGAGLHAGDQRSTSTSHAAQLARCAAASRRRGRCRGERAGVVAGRPAARRRGRGRLATRTVWTMSSMLAGDDDRDGPLVDREVPGGAGLVPTRDRRGCSTRPASRSSRRASASRSESVVTSTWRGWAAEISVTGACGVGGAGGRAVGSGVVFAAAPAGTGVFTEVPFGVSARGPGPRFRRRTAAGDPGDAHERRVHLTTHRVPPRQGLPSGCLRVIPRSRNIAGARPLPRSDD